MVGDLPDAMTANAVVVGTDPAGASTAYHFASLDIGVPVLERAQFPRDKICGDGLTPAAVHELILMGMDTSEWTRNRGLTVIGDEYTMTLGWPDQKSLPGCGMTRARTQLDHELITQARQAGTRLIEGATITGTIQDATGRVLGMNAYIGQGDRACEPSVHTRLVADCGEVAAHLATLLGLEKRHNRPMGVATHAYFHSPRGKEEFVETHLELWDGEPGESELLPGYDWIFPMGADVVNVGLGSVSSTTNATQLPYEKVFEQQTANLPEHWGFTTESQIGPLRSAALPVSFNRSPHYISDLVLASDADGMVSPFNGEGIAPALKADRFAAHCAAQALSRHSQAGFDRVMSEYPELLREECGGYYRLGRILVVLIEKPQIMQLCTNKGLPIPRLITFVNKLLSNGYEHKDGDLGDRLITILTRLVPSL